MAATLRRLRTRADRLRAEQADALRQLVLEYPGLPERPRGEIVAAIDRQAAAENGWTFVMLSPSQNKAVARWLAENSERPQKAMLLWAELFDHLCRDTGEISLTRDELAEAVGIAPTSVSEVMRELESIGAIVTRRERVAGMRGPGRAAYFMNPNVATNLSGSAHDKAQAEAPKLRLVEPA
jgi:Crp-like helix-turn-helix domain